MRKGKKVHSRKRREEAIVGLRRLLVLLIVSVQVVQVSYGEKEMR